MKVLVFGSVNIDHVYRLPHLVRPGETIGSSAYQKNEGGKGTNQAVALAKAGQAVSFAGCIGQDGLFMRDYLNGFGVDTTDLTVVDEPTGHAVIQVDEEGRNSIILFGGANQRVTPALVEAVLSRCQPGDTVLLQNEISCGEVILRRAAELGLQVALNPSPVSEDLLRWPLEKVNWLILNEIEAGDITCVREPHEQLDALLRRCPHSRVVLTLGEQGAIYADAGCRIRQRAVPVQAVDTTAAGDTFTGYFLRAALNGQSIEEALSVAAFAASMTVSRPGAGRSIPLAPEVEAAMREG